MRFPPLHLSVQCPRVRLGVCIRVLCSRRQLLFRPEVVTKVRNISNPTHNSSEEPTTATVNGKAKQS